MTRVIWRRSRSFGSLIYRSAILDSNQNQSLKFLFDQFPKPLSFRFEIVIKSKQKFFTGNVVAEYFYAISQSTPCWIGAKIKHYLVAYFKIKYQTVFNRSIYFPIYEWGVLWESITTSGLYCYYITSRIKAQVSLKKFIFRNFPITLHST